MKEIYLAAGCFWGAQHYFKKLDGVKQTVTGFANGNVDAPSYEQVYTDATGHAETVKVVYDPASVSLEFLLEMYFLAIDPVSLNRQGEDEGTRYRTGIYYLSDADLPVIRRVYASVQTRFAKPLAVEVLPLRCFFPAEEYHQDYLDRNPDGYCHLSPALFRLAKAPQKVVAYIDALKRMEALAEGESDAVALMADAAAILKEKMGFFWAGFYRVCGGELVLGPFQGPVACTRIGYGKGVCGTSWERNETVVVPDVEQFPGHIACSSLSRSEIVVPVRNARGEVCAVLDVDSAEAGAFDEVDVAYLERFAIFA